MFHLPSRARLRSRILPENFLCVSTYDKPDDNWFAVMDTYGKRYYCIAVNHEEEAALRERHPSVQIVRSAELHQLKFRVGLPETEPAARK